MFRLFKSDACTEKKYVAGLVRNPVSSESELKIQPQLSTQSFQSVGLQNTSLLWYRDWGGGLCRPAVAISQWQDCLHSSGLTSNMHAIPRQLCFIPPKQEVCTLNSNCISHISNLTDSLF